MTASFGCAWRTAGKASCAPKSRTVPASKPFKKSGSNVRYSRNVAAPPSAATLQQFNTAVDSRPRRAFAHVPTITPAAIKLRQINEASKVYPRGFRLRPASLDRLNQQINTSKRGLPLNQSIATGTAEIRRKRRAPAQNHRQTALYRISRLTLRLYSPITIWIALALMVSGFLPVCLGLAVCLTVFTS